MPVSVTTPITLPLLDPAQSPLLQQVLDLWLSRNVITRAQADALLQAARQRAFWLSATWQQQALQATHGLIERAIRDGMTAHDFRLKAEQILPRFEDGWYSELVRRVNTSTAQAQGRYSEMFADGPGTRARPYWQFHAAQDTRNDTDEKCPDTRCRWLHRKIFLKDDARANRFLPPLHFQCRCSASEVAKTTFVRKGYTAIPGSSIPFEPLEGWGGYLP